MKGFGTVKAVLSGDTVVVLGNSAPGTKPPELQMSLASLQAPRMSRHPKSVDEEFGWASREFLRTLVIGKAVKFEVEYSNTSGRKFGALWLHAPAAGQPTENIAVVVAGAGWAKVIPEAASKFGMSQDYDALDAASAAAEGAGAGIWTSDPAIKAAVGSRDLDWSPTNLAALAKEMKGQDTPAIVEQVRDGACLRCYVPSKGVMVTILMAGVSAPRVAYGKSAAPAPATAAAAEPTPGSAAAKVAGKAGAAPSAQAPFALESAFFTESRLLHRNVTLKVGGSDKYDNLIGRVEVPQGDISALLLKSGLARIAAWSLPFTSAAHAATLTGAESAAKAGKVRLWAAYKEPVITGTKHFTGTVIEVVSGDTLVVKPVGAAARRIMLASVRAPRLGGRSNPDQPWAREAKEFMRTAVIGRVVNVVVDYTRPAPATSANQDVRAHATVNATSRKGTPINVGVDLVTAGLAELTRHRSDDPRASCFEQLLLAEAEATEKKRGLHSGKKGGSKRFPSDLTSATYAQAKEYLPGLQRVGEVTGIVDYVFSGHRFKLTLPKENVTMIFAISGVKCPNAPRPGEPAAPLPTAGAAAAEATPAKAPAAGAGGKGGRAPEPWGAEARTFAYENLMQREVTVSVEAMDRNGCGLGNLWVGKGAGRSLWACEVLNLGFASLIPAAADRSPFADELYGAVEAAKVARKGIWYAYDAAAEKAKAAAKAASSAAPQDSDSAFLGITVCDVASGDTFSAHADADGDKLEAVTAALADMKAAHGTGGGVLPSPLKRGSMVAALFDEGGPSGAAWFRARINDNRLVDLGGGKQGYDVTFIDFGNGGVFPLSALRALDTTPVLVSTPPLARTFRLAYVRAPGVETEWGQAAGMALSQAAMGQKLIAKVYSRETDTNRLVAALFDEASPSSVNENLLRQGLVRLAKREFRSGKAKAAGAAGRGGVSGANAKDELEFLAVLEAAQEDARKGHVSMWVHGDVADSDDEPVKA